MITYRNAVPSDVIDLIALVEDYCDEIGQTHDLASIKKYIDIQLGKIPTVVAATSDKVVGVISFAVMPSPFCKTELIARKIACFVHKDYRSQGVGQELLNKAEELSKTNGAKKFFYSSEEAPNENYIPFETEYTKELK